jgi:hypothetical protein
VNAVGGRKNLIINGNFKISQRGDYTSPVTITAGGRTYTADRWAVDHDQVSSTFSLQDATLPNGEVVTSAKQTSSASYTSTYFHVIQKVEVESWMRGKVVTASGWVRTNKSGQGIRICDTVACNVSSSITADENWQYVSFTRTLPSTFTGGSLQIHPAFGVISGIAGDYVEWANFQLELGSVATDFEHRSYGEELALCQRYYEIVADCSQSSHSSICYVGGGYSFKYDQVNWHYTFAVPKRGAFTLEATTGTDYYKAVLFGESIVDTSVGMTASYQPLNGVHGYITGSYSGSTNGKAWLFQLNHASAKIAVSAEL